LIFLLLVPFYSYLLSFIFEQLKENLKEKIRLLTIFCFK
jgi:hypothetical protein